MYSDWIFATAQAAIHDINVCDVSVSLCCLVILFSILVFDRSRPSPASHAKPSVIVFVWHFVSMTHDTFPPHASMTVLLARTAHFFRTEADMLWQLPVAHVRDDSPFGRDALMTRQPLPMALRAALGNAARRGRARRPQTPLHRATQRGSLLRPLLHTVPQEMLHALQCRSLQPVTTRPRRPLIRASGWHGREFRWKSNTS